MKMNAFTQWNLQVLLFVIPEYLSPQSLKVKGLHNHTSGSQMSRLRHSECSYNNFSKVTHIIGYHGNKKVITLMRLILVSGW